MGVRLSCIWAFACLAWIASPAAGAEAAVVLPDSRGWEMVSPVEKNGGQVDGPGTVADGGVLQASADGELVTFSSATSFGAGAGAAVASQYLSLRHSGGWATANLTAPLYSASYSREDEGVPYQLFSPDLVRGLLLNGRRCRGEGSGCPVPNPPLAPGAPAGYQNYYLREGATYTALVGAGSVALNALDPAEFELRLAGASPDLRHVVLSTCAALTADATEAPLVGGCDPARPNLYEYSVGTGLRLLNLLPAQSQGTPGAVLAAQGAAVSADGSRVYWNDVPGGDLYLREGAATVQVDAAAGGGGSFETASTDGTAAFFTKGGHLFRFAVGSGPAVDLTPAGGVLGVLGASAAGSHVYYRTAAGLFLWNAGTTTKAAADADASNHPPTTGTARVSADGTRLLFVATAPITGYDNRLLGSGPRQSQVFLYDAPSGQLACLSCNHSHAPTGPSTVPGAFANGSAPGSTRVYKPRALVADGRRVFFDSEDSLATPDINADGDVYQWEAAGTGSCQQFGGCVALISSGIAEGGAHFADASVDGEDTFFLTDGSLVPGDPGGVDLYDARVGGGFPVGSTKIPCVGDACQPLPSEPLPPVVLSSVEGLGNPPLSYRDIGRCRKGKVRRQGECVKKKVKRRAKARRGQGKGRR